MTTSILAVVVDCVDALRVARFWAAALDRDIVERLPREYRVGDPKDDTTVLYFMDVPEPKQVKNRVHADVITDAALEDEVERLRALGATLIDYRDDAKTSDVPVPDRWAVLADPEGNEFCVTSQATLTHWGD
jgi:hypothetical protein